MRVEGVEFDEARMQACLDDAFEKNNGMILASTLVNAFRQDGMDVEASYRAADRFLQKKRKAGEAHYDNKTWTRVTR